MATLGTTAPVESVAVPWTLLLNCAMHGCQRHSRSANKLHRAIAISFAVILILRDISDDSFELPPEALSIPLHQSSPAIRLN